MRISEIEKGKDYYLKTLLYGIYGSFGSVVVSDTRGPRLESSHQQNSY